MMHTFGILLSIGAAFFWAVALILFKKGGQELSPIPLNLLKCSITLFLYVPTLALLDVSIFNEAADVNWVMFGISGFLGIAIADTLFFMALSKLEAGVIAITDCIYLPFVIILSYLFLGETLGLKSACGAALVVLAIFLGAPNQFKMSISSFRFNIGMIWAILAVFLIAVSLIIVKEELAKTDVILASFIRISAGSMGLYTMSILHPDRKKIFKELVPKPVWKFVIPASIIGNYLAVLMWLAGIKYTHVSIATILNQLSTVFIFLLSMMFLRETVSIRKLIAIGCAVSGAMLAAASV